MASPPNWFIALPVAAAALPAGSLASLPPGVARLHPDDLHVTVAFLGAVGQERARRAWGELPSAGTPLVTHTGARAALGRPARPSALGLDLDADAADGALAAFLGRWRDHLRAAAGVAAETRPLRPHLTLGRPPRRAGARLRQRIDDWLAGRDEAARIELDRIALYTRADRDGGRRFRQVERLAWR